MYKLFIIIFILFNISIYGMDNLNIKLSKKEKEWIAVNKNKNKNITIYLNKDRGLLNYNSKGQNKGIFSKIIKSLKKETGLNFYIINQETKTFRKSVDLGIPDIVMGVEDYKRNDKEYSYIEKPLELAGIIITRKESPPIHFNDDISGKTIVYEKDDQIKSEILKKYGNSIQLLPKLDPKECIEALLSGKADIYIDDYQDGLRYLINNKNNNIKLNHLSNVIKTDYYIGGKENLQPLINIIEKLFNDEDLNPEFFQEESLEYMKDNFKFSDKINEYLNKKKEIKVWIPSSEEFTQLYYLDKNNKSKGFLKDYFSEISKLSRKKIQFEKQTSNLDFDINPFILSVNGKELISKTSKIFITEPYIQIPLSIFNNDNDGYIPYCDNLKKYRIAVVNNSFIEEYLFSKGLGNNLIKFKNIEEVLTAVSSKKADILIGELQQINYFSKLYKVRDLKVAGRIDDKIELSFGINSKDETLYDLINSFNSEYSYRITEKAEKTFLQKIELVKDYKLSIIISIISIIALSVVYIYLVKFKNISIKLKKLTIGLVQTLESANTFNDEDTGEHIKRLSKYSELLAEELKISKHLINEIGLYASLHDVGKIGIPDNILKKPGKLTEEEFKIMRNHVEIGYNLMKDLDVSSVALNIIRYHHEKWNGTGYGKGLRGEDIPLEARIVAIADVYDALRQERVYKKPFTHEKSVEIIISESGKHFDPNLVKVFIKKHKIFEKIFDESRK